MSGTYKDRELARMPSGVSGLDTILNGGLIRGGVYIVQGTPGAGKTILANQMCFHHAGLGGSAVFVTMLSESHTRMLQHLRPMTFYDEEAIPQRLYYVSGFDTLESDGLKGVVDLVRREIQGHAASLLVLDGFAITEESAASDREFKKFVHEIQSHAAAAECTVLLLTNGSHRPRSPEYTMVDGLIELRDENFGVRTQRSLQVRKFRGSGFLSGHHPFRIDDDGVTLFPRIEAAYAEPAERDDYRVSRMATGVEGLDRMIPGGLPAETTNGVLGPSGVGKTTLGLQFVGRSSAEEPGLFFGFYETPERLRVKADALGIDLRGLEARGHVEIHWQGLGEHLLDEIAQGLLAAVRRRGVKRLFIDGLDGLVQAAVHPERMSRFIAVLAHQLRSENVTALVTIEDRDVLGGVQLPLPGMSSLLEGLIILRYAELRGRMIRLLSITKVRDSEFDPFLHEFAITDRGIRIGPTFSHTEALMTGFARKPNPGRRGQKGSGR